MRFIGISEKEVMDFTDDLGAADEYEDVNFDKSGFVMLDINTDEEHLSYQFTKDGFTLSDPATGRVLYTATNVEMEGSSPGFIVHITWDHAPGAAWNAHAKEKGWQQEMNLQVQICEGDDIIY